MAAASKSGVEPQSAARSSIAGLLRLVFGITLPVLALDQLSKVYISSHLALHDDIVLIPNLLDITYTLNPGAAFSLFVNMPAWFRNVFLLILAAIAIVVIVALMLRNPRFNLTSASLALILAGAIGNLIDRIWHGEVIDFILMHYYQHDYPVFNVADSAITIGVVLILIASFQLDGSPVADRG